MKKVRILIADDHELVRRGIRGLLHARPGWKVVGEAANGREAVEKATRLKPDVVIIDVTMPDLDGLQATRMIRDANPDMRVVVLTMHESDQMVRRVLDAGARGYVLKSDLAPHLVKAVKDVSAGKLFLTPRLSDIVLKGFLNTGNQVGLTERSKSQPTSREAEIIRLLAEGKANKKIAAELGITIRTVETHRARIMLKLGLHSLTELIHYAIRHKICTPPQASE
ncbi:MAG TPA: response regulator transcription factor [Candidatus Acidoferrales bacterium]|nr:response regulator transcription factor [Candidatus Acidoferrales bacterium]